MATSNSSSSSTTSTDFMTIHIDIDTEISILDTGSKFTYRIPSFSVLQADLRPIKYQLSRDDGSFVRLDGFIRADKSLETGKTPPFIVTLKDYCLVPVSVTTEIKKKLIQYYPIKL